jgi:hypothetical protein
MCQIRYSSNPQQNFEYLLRHLAECLHSTLQSMQRQQAGGDSNDRYLPPPTR